MQSFFDLEVWKKSRELKKKISILVKTFPSEENIDLPTKLFGHLVLLLLISPRGMGNILTKKQNNFAFIQEVH